LAAAAAVGAPGDLSLVSLSGGGAQGDQPAEASAVSADGRYVAFTSSANLAAVPTGGFVQLYLRDRVAGTTELVSSSAAGAPANASVDVENAGNVLFDISGDGRFVVFASTATNLTPADTDPALDVYRKDMVTGEVTLVSVSSDGAKANAAVGGDPSTSYDGPARGAGALRAPGRRRRGRRRGDRARRGRRLVPGP
jgi:Tol biopolymer transport system component